MCVDPDQPITARPLSKNPEKEGFQLPYAKKHCKIDQVPNAHVIGNCNCELTAMFCVEQQVTENLDYIVYDHLVDQRVFL